MTIQELIDIAAKASLNSYSPYSNFAVGASMLLKNGKTYKGCNIENASYGLTNCAERTCMFTAYADGVRKDDIAAFVEYSPKEHLIPPCGACRQVMSELLPLDCKIYMAYGPGPEYAYKETTLAELLPYIFTKKDMDND